MLMNRGVVRTPPQKQLWHDIRNDAHNKDVSAKSVVNFTGTGSQHEAFKHAGATGVVFAGDQGSAKQYYVCASNVDLYYFVFAHAPEHRCFYEIVREQRPVKLYFDLELEHGEQLVERMDALQNRLVLHVIEKLRTLFQREVQYDDVLVLVSDGKTKASRHLIFPTHFKDVHNLKAFVHTHVVPHFNEGVDKGVYTKNRCFRFYGNRKFGSERVLKSGRNDGSLRTHQRIFMESLVTLPPSDGESNSLLTCGVELAPPSASSRSVVPMDLELTLDDNERKAVCWVTALIREQEDVAEPGVRKDGASLKLVYQRTCERRDCEGNRVQRCRLGGLHAHQNFEVTISMRYGTVRYFCHGTNGHPTKRSFFGKDAETEKEIYLTPLPEALRTATPPISSPRASPQWRECDACDADINAMSRVCAVMCAHLPNWRAKVEGTFTVGERQLIEGFERKIDEGKLLDLNEMEHVYNKVVARTRNCDFHMERVEFVNLVKRMRKSCASATKRQRSAHATQERRRQAKRSKENAKSRDEMLKRLRTEHKPVPSANYAGHTDEVIGRTRAENTAILEQYDAEVEEQRQEYGSERFCFQAPTDGSEAQRTDDGIFDPSYFRVGHPVPGIIMPDLKSYVRTTYAAWINSAFDMTWWNDAMLTRDIGDIKVFTKMFCNPRSPRFMFEPECNEFYIWTGNLWEDSSRYANVHLEIMEVALHEVYKYREDMLAHIKGALEASVTLFEDIVLPSYTPGIDTETDRRFRATYLKARQEVSSCEAQLRYYTKHKSDVCSNRTIASIALSKNAMSTMVMRPKGIETSIWDVHPELIGTSTGVLFWANGCSSQPVIHRAGHPTDFCRARISDDVDWDQQYEDYVRTGKWDGHPCGHPCPTFYRFMQEMTGQLELERRDRANDWTGDKTRAFLQRRIDEEVRYFQTFFGKALSYEIDWAKFLTVYGENGGESKSELFNLLKTVFGPLVGDIADSIITKDPRASASADNGHDTHLSTIRHPHIGTVNEVLRKVYWHLKNLKGPGTTQEEIRVRLAHGSDYVKFTPKALPTLICNTIPSFEGGKIDEAVMRRLVLWTLDQRFLDPSNIDRTKFNEHPIDDTLKRRLAAEKNAVLAFFLRGMWLYDATPGAHGTQVALVDIIHKITAAGLDPSFCQRTVQRLPRTADQQAFLIGLDDVLRAHAVEPKHVRDDYVRADRATTKLHGSALIDHLRTTTPFWRVRGLPPCASLEMNKARYRGGVDSANTFLNECCVVVLGKTPSQETIRDFGVANFHSFYSAWCRADGRPPMDVGDFKARVLRTTCRNAAKNTGTLRVFIGLSWRPDVLQAGWYTNTKAEQT